MIAPYVAELKHYDENAPIAFFGCMALLAREVSSNGTQLASILHDIQAKKKLGPF